MAETKSDIQNRRVGIRRFDQPLWGLCFLVRAGLWSTDCLGWAVVTVFGCFLRLRRTGRCEYTSTGATLLRGLDRIALA
jgi:hypothetical protein